MKTTQNLIGGITRRSIKCSFARNSVKSILAVAGVAIILACSTLSSSAIHGKATYLNVAEKAVRLLDSPLTIRQRQLRNAENFKRLPVAEQQAYAFAVNYYSLFQLGSPGHRLTPMKLAQQLATVDVYTEAYAGALYGTFPTVLSGVQTLSGSFGEFLIWDDVIAPLPDPSRLESITYVEIAEWVLIPPANDAMMGQIIAEVTAQVETTMAEFEAQRESMAQSGVLKWVGKALLYVLEEAAEYVVEELWEATEAGARDDDGDGIPNKNDTDQDGDGQSDEEWGGEDGDDDGDDMPNDQDSRPQDNTSDITPDSEVWLLYLTAFANGQLDFSDLEFVPDTATVFSGRYFMPRYLQ